MRQGNIPADGTLTEELDVIPQFIGIKFGATGGIEKLTVTTDTGDVICNVDELGFKAIAESYYQTTMAETDVLYLPLATGQINQNCTVYIRTTAGVGGVDWYTASRGWTKDVPVCLRTVLNSVKKNSTGQIQGFLKMAVLDMGDDDVCTLTATDAFGGGSNQLFKEEFVSMAAMKYNNSSDFVVIDNTDQSVSSVNLSPDDDRTIVMHMFAINGATTPTGMQAEVAKIKVTSDATKQMSNQVAKVAAKALGVKTK